MVDLSDQPPVPPWDSGGDERVGLLWAGSLLIAFGWGVGVLANLALHWTAPAGGWVLPGPVHIGPGWGLYSWFALGLGLALGTLGAALIGLARATPRGPFVLPGAEY